MVRFRLTGVGTRFIASHAGWGGLARVDLEELSASGWRKPTTLPSGRDKSGPYPGGHRCARPT